MFCCFYSQRCAVAAAPSRHSKAAHFAFLPFFLSELWEGGHGELWQPPGAASCPCPVASHLGGLWDAGGSAPRPSLLTCSPVIPIPAEPLGAKGGHISDHSLEQPEGVAWGVARTKLTWARVLPRARNSQYFCISTSNQRREGVIPAGGSCWGLLSECSWEQVSPPPSIGILVAGLARTRLGWSQAPANPGLAWLQVSAGGSTHPPPHSTPAFHADTSSTECPRRH